MSNAVKIVVSYGTGIYSDYMMRIYYGHTIFARMVFRVNEASSNTTIGGATIYNAAANYVVLKPILGKQSRNVTTMYRHLYHSGFRYMTIRSKNAEKFIGNSDR